MDARAAGCGGLAGVGDGLAGPDAVDVAGGDAPCGYWPEAGAGCDAADGVAGADGDGSSLCRSGRCRGWCGCRLWCGLAGGVGVAVPLPGFAAEYVEVERARVAVEASVGGVLAHGFPVGAEFPGVLLPSGGGGGCVLSNPQAALASYVSWDLVDGAGLYVHHGPYAGSLMDAMGEAAYPVAVAPCAVLVGFPVEDEHGAAHIRLRVGEEVVGFTYGVVAAGVMVEAEAFARICSAAGLSSPGAVDEAGALGDLDDGEVGVDLSGDGGGLPAGDVNALHVCHGARGECGNGYEGGDEAEQSGEGSGHVRPFLEWVGWVGLVSGRVVPVVSVEATPVVVGELLVAHVTGPVTAEGQIGFAGLQLILVLDAGVGVLEQCLPVDFEFEPANGGTGSDSTFMIPVAPGIKPAEYPLDDGGDNTGAQEDADEGEDDGFRVHYLRTPGMWSVNGGMQIPWLTTIAAALNPLSGML